MSAKILHSMSEEDSTAAQRHIGCINGIFHLFDRHHSLQGRRLGGHGHHKKLSAAGQKGSLDLQANEASHISTMKNSKPVIDKQRLSTDSSRSSVSSCNSSSFSSSVDDAKLTLQRSERSCSTQQGPSEISKLVRDSILHRDVRGITVKAASKEESRALTYVDSPRPSLPSPNKHKNNELGIDRSRSLRSKESPRYSYDGRESRSDMKIKEFPRYSLDSKRPNSSQLDRVVLSDTNQEPESRRRQSSLVAKLMGLEDLEQHEKVISPQVYVPKPTSRNSRIIPVELEPWKRQELDRTQCLESEGNGLSIYGEMEKRLAQIEFAKLGKDLRALKHILQSMQNSNKIREEGTETDTCSIPCSPTIKKRCSPKNIRTLKATRKTETAKVSASIVVTVSNPRKLDLGDKKLGRKKLFEEKRRGAEKTKNQHSPRKISATASPRLQRKKPNLLDSPRSKNSGRQAKNSSSSDKSKSQWDLGSELSGDSRELSEQNNGVSLQSDGGISRRSSSHEEIEVTSEYRPKKMELLREEGLVGKRLICTVEQPSPVSVLDPRIYEDESLSPVRLISNAFEDVEALNYDQTPSPSSDTTISISFIGTNPNHIYISEILLASDLFKDLDSASILQLQQSGDLMTENMFLALEETKSNNLRKVQCSEEVLERRLIFDVVNQILGRKVESFNRILSNHNKQQLLKELCEEIDHLPCILDEEDEDCFRIMLEKDLKHDSMGWINGSWDISEVAVTIERMIFRDLISEVVSSDASVVRARGSGYRRQLF